MTVHLVLVKGRPLRHASPATYVRTGTAGLRSLIDLIQRWIAYRKDHPLLFGGPGNAPEWRSGTLSAALARALEAVTRSPPPGTSWTSHSLRIDSHTEQTLLGNPIVVRKARFGWEPDSDDTTSLYFDRQYALRWRRAGFLAHRRRVAHRRALHADSSRSSRTSPNQAGFVLDRFRQV
jgi:hypothetical protein